MMMFRSLTLLLFIVSQNIYPVNSDKFIGYLLNSNNIVQIDFFIIQNLTIEERDLNEKWKQLEKLEFSDELIEIKSDPTILINMPSSAIVNDNFLQKIDVSSFNSETGIQNKKNLPTKKAQPFLYEKIPFLNEINDIEDNLNRSKDYRVIYHNSWFQPVLEKDKSIPIYIESKKKDKKVYGEIKIYKERFTHLDSKIRFAEKTEDKELVNEQPNIAKFQDLLKANQTSNEEIAVNENYWISTIFNTVKLNIQSFSDFIYPENKDSYLEFETVQVPEYKYNDLYEIDRETKLEQEKFNFIDHPYFSILIRVTEHSN